ncbi:hypothetical protein HaLaN_07061 [Haematococcus lacustris]|uniref:Uncharacterized protein n=1 Tax=Haematococcus lacustris TaxID=44745 RepID=A0A699YMN9_HAELA|nr:hypothetical protein HaLaN_07061 [Haematococcus lacustris]
MAACYRGVQAGGRGGEDVLNVEDMLASARGEVGLLDTTKLIQHGTTRLTVGNLTQLQSIWSILGRILDDCKPHIDGTLTLQLLPGDSLHWQLQHETRGPQGTPAAQCSHNASHRVGQCHPGWLAARAPPIPGSRKVR